ncbi:MAG: hypothetical protein IJ562_12540 [Prevotella sp.]|nr:hypothetical protein [Prevotella sp.]
MGTSESINSYHRLQPFIEIMDCTLRDGEQTSGVSFLPHEKLMIARVLLHDVNVDRIEVASARVSDGEKDAVSMICRYAEQHGMLSRVEVLGFVDGGLSVNWIAEAGCKVVNLLAKGSEKHCNAQLNKSVDSHIADILECVRKAEEKGMVVNLYLEDWSNGMKDSPEYVYSMLDVLTKTSIRRFMLPDTLGIVSDVLKHDVPEEKIKLVSYMVSTAYGLKPLASIKVEIGGRQYEADSTGDGQYDAFVKALRKIYKDNLGRTFPILANYAVSIPPGGRTDALVQTVITWHNGDKLIRTRGLDADQTEAAIKATIKMLNIFETQN